MSSASSDPVSFLSGDQPAQLARAHAAATNMPSASATQIEDSMTAQASALSQSVDAVGEAQGALATVGATFGVLIGVEQMLSTVLSAIPFPALPAVRIADFDIGFPHAHSHPPNLIPPAPPIPLPSMGPVIPIPILSGASTVLVNGMPAGRCGDMGLGIWCGGYFPLYEVFLGSSSVWIEGARAARMLVDITRALPVHGAEAARIFRSGRCSARPSARARMCASAVCRCLRSMAIAFGAALRGAFKLAGKGARAFARATAPLRRRMGNALPRRQLSQVQSPARRAGEFHHRRGLGRAARFFDSRADPFQLDALLRLAADPPGQLRIWLEHAGRRAAGVRRRRRRVLSRRLRRSDALSPSARQRLGARDRGRQPAGSDELRFSCARSEQPRLRLPARDIPAARSTHRAAGRRLRQLRALRARRRRPVRAR